MTSEPEHSPFLVSVKHGFIHVDIDRQPASLRARTMSPRRADRSIKVQQEESEWLRQARELSRTVASPPLTPEERRLNSALRGLVRRHARALKCGGVGLHLSDLGKLSRDDREWQAVVGSPMSKDLVARVVRPGDVELQFNSESHKEVIILKYRI
ncbi:CLASP [Symbiodinium necroappetens]|uniref:CLASP protein n=1 Tax=Symbiodinium necroappetens TaxID=1628268 RepID=A0A813AII4_9DINO|nr:CLASP [Symbiodinium necroappetens]